MRPIYLRGQKWELGTTSGGSWQRSTCETEASGLAYRQIYSKSTLADSLCVQKYVQKRKIEWPINDVKHRFHAVLITGRFSGRKFWSWFKGGCSWWRRKSWTQRIRVGGCNEAHCLSAAWCVCRLSFHFQTSINEKRQEAILFYFLHDTKKCDVTTPARSQRERQPCWQSHVGQTQDGRRVNSSFWPWSDLDPQTQCWCKEYKSVNGVMNTIRFFLI